MKTNGQLTTILFVAGRFIAGGMYLIAGIQNLMQLEAKAGYTASKGVSNATFWVIVASLLLVFGGISVLTGIRPHLGVGALALFLIPVTLIMHNFWAMTGMQATIEFHAFMGNVGLFGSALLFVAIPQPWPVSVDEWLASKAAMFPQVRERVAGRQTSVADSHATD
jgi:putative oxidoreductase